MLAWEIHESTEPIMLTFRRHSVLIAFCINWICTNQLLTLSLNVLTLIVQFFGDKLLCKILANAKLGDILFVHVIEFYWGKKRAWTVFAQQHLLGKWLIVTYYCRQIGSLRFSVGKQFYAIVIVLRINVRNKHVRQLVWNSKSYMFGF